MKDHVAFTGPFLGLLHPADEGNAVPGYTGNHSPKDIVSTVAHPGIFFGGGWFEQIQLRIEDRERGSGGGSPLVRGSGDSCSLVQEISFHIVKFSQFLVL